MAENKSAHDHLREKATDTTEAHDASSVYATVADFMTGIRKSSFTLSDEKTIEFRALKPLDCQNFMGSSLSASMTEAGIAAKKVRSIKARDNYILSLSVTAQEEIVIESARQVIVEASVSPEFSMLPIEKCPTNKVPVKVLSRDDTYNLRDAIEAFSGVKKAEEEFREDGGADAEEAGSTDAEGTGEPADDSTDGEGVRTKSV